MLQLSNQDTDVKIQIECQTRFDITATGVRNYHKIQQSAVRDEQDQAISDLKAWTHARNQQRNWDTVNQIISLRSLPENITPPHRVTDSTGNHWRFSFDIPDAAAVATAQDPVGLLVSDCCDVPMITGLDEDSGIGTVLDPKTGGNISFRVDHGK